jgi:hypothetical protein
VALTIHFKHSIRLRILAILVIMGVSYALLLAMVEFNAAATSRHMDQLSSMLIPATMQLIQAENSFVETKKHYEEAVLLEQSNSLADANRDAAVTADALGKLRASVAESPALTARVDDIAAQFYSIRSRAPNTYDALLASKLNVSDDVQARVAALSQDSNRLTVPCAILRHSSTTRAAMSSLRRLCGRPARVPGAGRCLASAWPGCALRGGCCSTR